MSPDDALRALEVERLKPGGWVNYKEMRRLIHFLRQVKVYPPPTFAMIAYGISYVKMVERHGAWWFRYPEPQSCPKCAFDLRDLKFGPPSRNVVMFPTFGVASG